MDIVIYGFHCPTWNNMFSNKSNLWKILKEKYEIINHYHIPNISKISNVNNSPFVSLNRLIILPLLENDSKHIKSMEHLYKNKVSLVPTIETVDIFSNKHLFWQFMKNNNLSDLIPKTYKYMEAINDIEYPCIIKPINLNNGQQMTIVNSVTNLIDVNLIKNKEQYIIQEYISDPNEYVSHCVVQNGKIIHHITYLNIYEKDQYIRSTEDKPVKREKVVISDAIIKYFEQVLECVQYDGICNIDYKCKNNKPIIFEINPRLGGSLMSEENIDDLATILCHTIDSIIKS
jgi:carbamoylphosphate synthase large subunit